jgi:hypothetical protein
MNKLMVTVSIALAIFCAVLAYANFSLGNMLMGFVMALCFFINCYDLYKNL